MALSAKKKAFLRALEQTLGNVIQACKQASRSTYYEWLKNDEEFVIAVMNVNESNTDMVESALLDNIMKGDTTSIIFYLKTRAKDRGYVERQEYVDRTNYVESFSDLVKAADKEKVRKNNRI